MASDTRPLSTAAGAGTRPRQIEVDADGVRTIKTSPGKTALWLVALAIALPITATFVAVAVIRTAPGDGRQAAVQSGGARGEEIAERGPAAAPARPVPPAAAEKLIPKRVAAADGTPATNAAAGVRIRERKPKPEIGAAEAIAALREEGETGGIAAFPPPGTKPVKSGIIVPEEFELPEGYVRHYQTTDDGRQLPAILMFHPDYQFVNERGEPVAVPADRIVPPEMAPPGMRIELLDVPAPDGTADSRR